MNSRIQLADQPPAPGRSGQGAAGGGEVDNTFDAPVHYLLQYQMGGLPLPYFILLKIAQDILEIAAKHIVPSDVPKAT